MRLIGRIIKYISLTLLALVIVLVVVAGALYLSADMKSPNEPLPNRYTLALQGDSLRTYGPNWLRLTPSGLWEMKVQGAPLERGQAMGVLSSDLLHYQEEVFVHQIRTIVPSDAYLRFLRFFVVIFNRHLGEHVPEEYRREIYGISQYCSHEFDAIGTPYERQLNYHAAHDLGHALQDYMMVGCSSFAARGAQTASGKLLIGRNFDFYVGDDFARHKIILFVEPDSGYRFASVTWPGMIGVLSGMNEAGLTVTINASQSDIPTSAATPISILTREILQYASTIDEAYAIAQRRQTFVSESILIGSARDGRAAIIEKSPERIDLYRPSDELIGCTNHYQSATFAHDERNVANIRTSDSPYRLRRLGELARRYRPLTPEHTASILRDRQGEGDSELGMTNELALNQLIAHHSVILEPEARRMWVSTTPWQCGAYVAYDLKQVFASTAEPYPTLATDSLGIGSDPFLQSPEYRQLLTYRELLPVLRKAVDEGRALEPGLLARFETSNPHYYYTHALLGDYHHGLGEHALARRAWQRALERPIPHERERQALRDKLR